MTVVVVSSGVVVTVVVVSSGVVVTVVVVLVAVVGVLTRRVVAEYDVDGCRVDAALLDGSDDVGHVEGGGVLDGGEGVPVRAGRQQGTQQHVAGRTHPAVERERSHTSLASARGKKSSGRRGTGTGRWPTG